MIKCRHPVFEMTVAIFLKLLESRHESAGILFSDSNEFLEFNTMQPQLSFLPEEHESGRQILDELGIRDKVIWSCPFSPDRILFCQRS